MNHSELSTSGVPSPVNRVICVCVCSSLTFLEICHSFCFVFFSLSFLLPSSLFLFFLFLAAVWFTGRGARYGNGLWLFVSSLSLSLAAFLVLCWAQNYSTRKRGYNMGRRKVPIVAEELRREIKRDCCVCFFVVIYLDGSLNRRRRWHRWWQRRIRWISARTQKNEELVMVVVNEWTKKKLSIHYYIWSGLISINLVEAKRGITKNKWRRARKGLTLFSLCCIYQTLKTLMKLYRTK